jgi:hypothetical protein
MARPDTIAIAQRKAAKKAKGIGLIAGDRDEFISQAEISERQREECAREIDWQFELYRSRVAEKNAPNAGSQAKELRLVGDAARHLKKSLTRLPAALRANFEPDYAAFIRCLFGKQEPTAEQTERDQRGADDMELLSITVDQYAALPGRPDSTEFAEDAPPTPTTFDDLLARARAPLPLELMLAALIETIECCQAPARSKQRRVLWRDELASNLKSIVTGYSPRFKKNSREAEKWVAAVLDAAKIDYPDPEKNPSGFSGMFLRG